MEYLMADAAFDSLGLVLIQLLDLVRWAIIIAIIVQMLVSFNVISITNDVVRQIYMGLRRFTDVLCDPIRRLLPDMGGIDFSPVLVLIGISGLQYFIGRLL
jgi:YggT family protein